MISLFRTLSIRYIWRHWVRALLVIASIALGVAAWVATEALYGTVTRSLRQAASPLRGTADFYVTNSAARYVDASLGESIARVPGVARVEPITIENVRLVRDKPIDAVLLGLKVPEKQEDQDHLAQRDIEVVDFNRELYGLVLMKKGVVETTRWLFDNAGRFLPIDSRRVLQSLIQPPILRPVVGPQMERLARLEPVLVGEVLDEEVLHGHPQFVIEAGGRRLEVIVVGKARATGPAAMIGGRSVIMDWQAAAKLLGQPGKVSRLDVVLKPDANRDEVMQRVEGVLAGQAKVQTASGQDDRLRELLKGLEIGFRLCGAGALVVGLFLVYNAMSVSVAERRHDIGILRSVGATRTQVRALFLAEALIMGMTGATLGLPLGVLIAHLSLGAIQRVLEGIFLPSQRDAIQVSTEVFLTAGLGGLLTALLASLVPASRAAAEEPADAVRRAPPSPGIAYRLLQIGGSATLILLGVVLVAVKPYLTPERVRNACLILVGVGVALTAAGNWLLGRTSLAEPETASRYRPLMAVVYGLIFIGVGCAGLVMQHTLTAEKGTYAALVLVLLGSLLSTPMLAAGLTGLMQRLLRLVLPIESRLALDNLVRSPGRTGLVIAALAAGVALTVQTAGVIKSNEVAYREWLDITVKADLYVAAGGAASPTGQQRSLSARVSQELLDTKVLPPGTRAVGQVSRYPEWDSKNRRSGVDAATGSTRVFMSLIDAHAYHEANIGRLASGDLDLWRQLGEVKDRAIVSQNFAQIHDVWKGDRIHLESNSGPVSFEVIGVITDYGWIRGTIWIDRPHNRTAFAADEVSVLELYLPPMSAQEIEAVRTTMLQSEVARQHSLIAVTRDEVRDNYLSMIYNLFGLAYTQEVVVGIVAVIGVVTSLLISVLGRTREIGLLRAVGATRGQVLHTVLAEAVLIGVVGTILGILIGLPLEWYVVRVILFEEAGFLFPVQVPWVETGVITLLAILSATFAGLAPAVQAVRLRISDAIAYE